MNPILDKMKEWDPRYLYLLLGVVILLVVVLDFFLFMRPQIGLIGALDKSIVELRTNISNLSDNNQRMAQFNAQLELARKARKNFEAMVFRKDEVPTVLKNISSLANECGVRIDQLVPQSLSAKPLVESKEGKYFTMNIAVRIRSGYHRFGKFLNRMEQQHLFWQVEGLSILADPKDSQREDIKMDIKILVLEK